MISGPPIALTAKQLDEAHCAVEDCPHDNHELLHFHGRCHINSPVEVAYSIAYQSLFLTCSECGGAVAVIKVAKE